VSRKIAKKEALHWIDSLNLQNVSRRIVIAVRLNPAIFASRSKAEIF
jgi:hypothetical protein